MQFLRGKPSVGIFYDTDLGDSIDSVLALAVLHGLQDKNEARVVSLTLSRPDLETLKFGEILQRFFSGAKPGAEPQAGVGVMKFVPVGMPWAGKPTGPKPAVSGFLETKKPDGSPLYQSEIHDKRDSADPCTLFRNLLEAQYDHNAIFFLAGPATNLAAALDFRGVKSLIEAKVRYLVIAGGAFPDGPAENHIKTDIASAKRVFAEWPTPIFTSGTEIGKALEFPGASIDKEFALIPDHPVAAAYRAFRPMPYDAPAMDVAAALYAGRPKENYFKLSGPGTISVRDDGRTVFTPSPQGKHQYLIADPGQKQKILETCVQLASAKPVPPRRFRPPVDKADQEKADLEKADEPKKDQEKKDQEKKADPADQVVVPPKP
jgi:hypothetical protein